MKGDNILDIIKCELLDTKIHLELFLKKQDRKRKHPISITDREHIKARINRLSDIIKCIDNLNCIKIPQ